MARPTLPDTALVGDAGHTQDHNTIRDALVALFEERITGTGSPEGQITAVVGALYVDTTLGALWVKMTGSGNTGWQEAVAGSKMHASLAGLTVGNDHPQYQLRSEEGVASGYASLDASAKVPIAQLNMGTAAGTVSAGDHIHPDLVPIGAVIAYGGTAAPAGWLLCNGAAIPAQYTALIALVGSVTPNLLDRFVVGAGSGYAVKNTGGEATHLLTANESGLRDHAHTAYSGGINANHYHSVGAIGITTTTDSHNHTLSIREGTGTGDGSFLDTNPTDAGNGNVTLSGSLTSTDSHNHTATVAAHNTGYVSADHAHPITVNASGAYNAVTAHENRPPYYALTYIIRAL